jgi:Tol biopolymer transport system component
MIGTRLGQYTIEARLGAGGMGVVYRAYDERLRRIVAIKLVGDAGPASTPDEREKLLDEARAASHLSHPHICTVYEAGDTGGRAFIAMEYVDGRPLAQLVPHDGLPTETIVAYGTQIADALAHAHAHGVLHRDLKTANVVIGASGAKVLDFGLARRVDPRSSDSVTQSVGAVDAGIMAGTLAYMAPEVLLGQPIDARTDIWSLGVVLYEIATGGLPFKGQNQFELSAAIARDPVQPFPSHVPPALRSVILRCLSKEPAQRYQHAGEVRAALEAIQSGITTVAAGPPRPRRRVWPFAAAILVVVAAILGWTLLGGRPGPWERGASGKLVPLRSTDEVVDSPALSPDGSMIAFTLQSDGRVDLYASRVSGGARIRLTDDDAFEDLPRFSADGERIAFTVWDSARGVAEIRIVPALGGDVLVTIPGAAYPAWSQDGRLAYVRRADSGTELAVAKADGSEARGVLAADGTYPFLRNPAWSPDGRNVAVIRGTGGSAGEIWLVPASGGTPRRLLDEPATVASDFPMFTPDGRGIIHSSSRGGSTNIWFASLASSKLVRLTTGPGPDASPTIAANGSIAFINSRWRNVLQAYSLATGGPRTLDSHTPYIWGPAISPDGRTVAFARGDTDGTWHLWTVPFGGGAPRQLTSTESGEIYPRWMRDRRTMLFTTWNNPRRVGRVDAEGGPPVFLSFGAGDASYADPSPDGRSVVFSRSDREGERLYVAPIAGGAPTLLMQSPGATPRWSPDGSLVAFGGNRGYGGGIFVIRPGDAQGRRLTSEGGWPVWWPDGRQVGYIALGPGGNEEIRVVSIDGGAARTLPIRLSGSNHPFAVTNDAQGIVVSNSVHISSEIWLLQPGK